MLKKVPLSGLNLPGLFERNGTFVFRKAIPEPLRPILGGRREFIQTLKTRCPDQAVARYGQALAAYNLLIENARRGVAPISAPASSDIAFFGAFLESVDLSYRPFETLVRTFDPSGLNCGITEFLHRAEVWAAQGKPDDHRFDALFGSVKPTVTFTDVLDNYIQHTRLERLKLNEREFAKKLNPRRLAIRTLQDFLGTDDTDALSPESVRAFREHVADRVAAGELQGSTANKHLGHLRVIFDTAIQTGVLQSPNPFLGVRLPEEQTRRNAFSMPFARDTLLPALSTLDPNCRALLWAVIDTGANFSELCGLHPERDIQLDSPIPFIRIEPNEYRQLKTGARPRELPLCGLALKAFREFPAGFETYRRPTGPESASANCNKFFRNNGLVEPGMFRSGNVSPQTVYSLRHMFKDRLREHQVPADIQDAIMGHKSPGMGTHYGVGYTVAQMRPHMDLLSKDFEISETKEGGSKH